MDTLWWVTINPLLVTFIRCGHDKAMANPCWSPSGVTTSTWRPNDSVLQPIGCRGVQEIPDLRADVTWSDTV